MKVRALASRTRPREMLYKLCALIIFVCIALNSILHKDAVVRATVGGTTCELPSLQVAVITLDRAYSLERLLVSLTSAHYHCARVDLLIVIDNTADAKPKNRKVVQLAQKHHWPHGLKIVTRRIRPAGLSLSWFELPYITSHKYLAIFEDDMEVNLFYYDFFSTLHVAGALGGKSSTGFCLHPNDWELHNEKDCHSTSFSRYLYESPEPCNWGPIWKTEEWAQFLDWVTETKALGELPYIRNDTALNWNLYLDQGKDVQSSWVWKYNWLFNKVQIRYTFKTCDLLFPQEVFFAINHKEPGEHFKEKFDIDNDPKLLTIDYALVKTRLKAEKAHQAAKFPGYARNVKSLRGR